MNNDFRYQVLLRKFLRNECTEEEIQELISHLKETDAATELPSVEEVLEELDEVPRMSSSADDRMYNSIVKAKKKARRRGTNRKTLRRLSLAAVFIGILALGYFSQEMLLPSEPAYVEPRQNQITLQLENGSVQVIRPNFIKNIVNSEGYHVAKVNGSQLVYNSEKPADSLIYNQLTVPYGKTFELNLADGTGVQLNAGTTFKFPVNFIPGERREVFLEGEAYFNVASDHAHPFVVNADQLKVQVLGTQFNVLAYPEDKETQVVLVEGSVGMYHEEENQHQVVLMPGDRGVFDKEGKSFVVNEVPTSVYTSWVHGELVFRDLAFDQVLKQLERHYNVKIENNLEDIDDETINGNFGKEPLENVLEYLTRMYDLEYFIDGDNVIVK